VFLVQVSMIFNGMDTELRRVDPGHGPKPDCSEECVCPLWRQVNK
jgi:hypothetical protein